MAKSMRWIIPVTLLLLATISSVIAGYADGIVQVALADAEAAEETPAATVPAVPAAEAPAAGLPRLFALPGVPTAAAVPVAPQGAPVAPPAVAPPAGQAPPTAINPAAAPAAEPPAMPRSRIKSSGKNPSSANQYGIAAPGKARTGPAVIVVLPMQNNNADTVLRMLESLLDPEESDAVRTTVDSQSNSLIVRGTVEDIEKIRKVVEQLDRQQTRPQSGYDPPVADRAPALPPHVIPYITSSDGVQWPVPYRVYSEAEGKLQQEFAKLDQQSSELAKRYRHNAQTLGNEHPEQKRRRDDITAAVAKAFDARQEIQTQELKQLKERLAKVEQSVGKRSTNRDEIIAKRVRELLEDDRDLEWNGANRTNAATYYPAATVADPLAVTPAKPLYRERAVPVLPPPLPPSQKVEQPDPNANQVQELASPYLSEATKPSGQGAVSPSNQRNNLSQSQILGLSASDLNQPAGADQRQALEAAQERLLREESKVATLKKRLSESKQPVAVEEDAEYQQALSDLELAKRQLNNAKREADTVLKLLTLDLQLAKTQLDGAADELKAASSQPGQEDSRAKLSTAVRQAQLRVERAETLLEHHSTMLKSTLKDSEEAVPGTTPTRR